MGKIKKSNKIKEKINNKIFLYCLFILLSALSIFNLSYYIFSKPKTIYVVNNTLGKKIDFWQNFLISHPSYFEGWIELSKLHLKNGNVNEAHFAFLQAYKINPNSEEVGFLENEFRSD